MPRHFHRADYHERLRPASDPLVSHRQQHGHELDDPDGLWYGAAYRSVEGDASTLVHTRLIDSHPT
jgi:hypothetical protein